MKKFITVLLISFFIFLTLIAGGTYLYINGMDFFDEDFARILSENPHIKLDDPKDNKVVNWLVMGIDDARSDVMMVVRFNKENKKIALISIPRDTRVNIPNYGYNKINSALARKEGAPLAMKTVENLLGIPIHYYATIDFEGAEKIIDLVGGVKVNVPMDMNYEDPTQNLYIHIKKGEQVLDGKNGVKFLRFRSGYSDQDLGRIKAQQEFIKAFMKKMTSPAIIPKAFKLLDAMSRYVKTNMTQAEIASYALKIQDMKVENLKTYTLPGAPGYRNKVSYFIYDEEKLREMMNNMDIELGADGDNSETKDLKSTHTENSKSYTVEILNSTSRSGLATKMKEKLEKAGYTVKRIGNTQGLSFNSSRIIDKRGNKDAVNIVKKDTGISIVDIDIDNSYDCDITIVIGKDNGGM